MLGNELNLEDSGPQLASDEQALAAGVVGNSIQDGARFQTINRAQQPLKVDPSQHLTIPRGDSGDSIRLPDVGKKLSIHELHFVQFGDAMISIVNGKPSLLRQRSRIQYANLRRSVTHKDFAAVSSQPPPFSGVGESPQEVEVVQAVDKSGLGLPG